MHTRIGIVVVDRKESLIIESKDDTKDNSYDASELAAYSNSKPIALSYASIFESLWKQAELYEQLKVHNKMQKEFINIAAHELRTPIQPILGLSELLHSKISNNNDEQKELLDTIIRNAKRLQRLADDILDVTKIESQSLQLKKEWFNITQMILNALADYRRNDTNKQKKEKIKVLVAFKEDIFVEADRDRLNQVICNLISNAFKCTVFSVLKSNPIVITMTKMDLTRTWLPVPPPKFFVQFLPNSLTVRPGDVKVVELFVNSTINLQAFRQVNVSLLYLNETMNYSDLLVNIVPNATTMPSYGLLNSQLHIEVLPNATGNKVYVLPLHTHVFFPSLQRGNNSGFDANITSYFTITVLPALSIPEYLMGIVNTWGSPVKELVALVTGVGAVGTILFGALKWIRKNKKTEYY